MTGRAALPDGSYSAIVLDASERPRSEGGGTRVDVTVTSGEHRGLTMSLVTEAGLGDPIALMGLPVALDVADGEPRLRFEP